MTDFKEAEGALCELIAGPPDEIVGRLTQRGMPALVYLWRINHSEVLEGWPDPALSHYAHTGAGE